MFDAIGWLIVERSARTHHAARDAPGQSLSISVNLCQSLSISVNLLSSVCFFRWLIPRRRLSGHRLREHNIYGGWFGAGDPFDGVGDACVPVAIRPDDDVGDGFWQTLRTRLGEQFFV
jgi:hypothetical protein